MMPSQDPEPQEVVIPSKEYVNSIRELKRKRREHQENGLFDPSLEEARDTSGASQETHLDQAQDGYTVEPFSLEDNETPGTFNRDGFFVFTRKGTEKERRPLEDSDSSNDPWFESLKAPGNCSGHYGTAAKTMPSASPMSEGHVAEQELEKKSTATLLHFLVSHLDSDEETPAQALKRLAPRKPASETHSNAKRGRRSKMDAESQKVFNVITEHCHALMLTRNLHDIFSMTRAQLIQLAKTHEHRRVNETPHAQEPCEAQGTQSSEESFWRVDFGPSHNASNAAPVGPQHYSLSDIHDLIRQGYISKKRPARVMEVSRDNGALHGVWYSWETLIPENFDTPRFPSGCNEPSQDLSSSQSSLSSSSDQASEDYDVDD